MSLTYDMLLSDAIAQTLADGACQTGDRGMVRVEAIATAQPGMTLGQFATYCRNNDVRGAGAFAAFVLGNYEITDTALRNRAGQVLLLSPYSCWGARRAYLDQPDLGSWKLFTPSQRQQINQKALELRDEWVARRLDKRRLRMLLKLATLTDAQRTEIEAQLADPTIPED